MKDTPVVLFQGGTHGNFLSRCLSVASGVCDDFDFYGSNRGAHARVDIKDQVVNHVHEHNNSEVWTYINIDQSDLYILNWHILYAAGEFGIDVLTVNSFDKLIEVVEHKSAHSIVVNGFRRQVEIFKQDGTSGLREMFKKSFSKDNGVFDRQDEVFKNHSVSHIFKFSWFYKLPDFIQNVKLLLQDIGYNYVNDIEHHWQDFINRKKNILDSKKRVEVLFDNYVNKNDVRIDNLCVYEQAYLDFLIEKRLGYEIENWVEYPVSTGTMNPVQAWEGVRYEL